MNVLHCIPSLTPSWGGPSTFLRHLAHLAEKPDLAIEIACMDPPGSAWLEDIPCTVHAFSPVSTTWGYTPRLAPWLAKHRHRFDLVIAHDIWHYITYAVWQALKGSTTPYCIFAHGMLDRQHKAQHPYKHLKKYAYWLACGHRIAGSASAILFTSAAEQQRTAGTFSPYRINKIVVPYGTLSPEGSQQSQRKLLYRQYTGLEQNPFLLYLGRIHEKKGLDLLVEAFSRLNGANCCLQLLISGPETDSSASKLRQAIASLPEAVKQRIIWTGELVGPIKWGALRAAQALILPSHQENFAMTVVEALACGTPVLVSNQVNIWPFIERQEAGLVEPDTESGTERLLARWLALGPDDRLKMQVNARRCFNEHFNLKTLLPSYLETLKEVIALHKSQAGRCEPFRHRLQS